MIIKKVTLKNFRNIKELSFLPSKNINFLVGSNGQGKTSIIEALGILSTLRSFRDSKNSNLIQWGQLNSEISCELTSSQQIEVDENLPWIAQLKTRFLAQDEKRDKITKVAMINEKPYRSSTQYLSQRFGSHQLGFHSIVFNPSDHDLVRGDPAARRAYLNRVIAAEDIEYLKALQKYQRILEQRNAILKTQLNTNPVLLDGFTEQLCEIGVQITLKRLQWIQRVNEGINLVFQKIASEQPELQFRYLSPWIPEVEKLTCDNNKLSITHFSGQGALPSLKLLEQSFCLKVSALKREERKAGHSLVGPHRDDWGFFFGNHLLKGHGSQGEVRSALFALKLCEIELFRKSTGHRPLFLLDDFSSELDQRRRSFLLDFLVKADLQTFITTTEMSSVVGKRFWVSNGAIEEGQHDD